jgi:hypothetical protein
MAGRFNFTRDTLGNLCPSEQGSIAANDDAVRGLLVNVSKTGTKSFLVYRKFGGRPLKITLGQFDPEIPETRELPDGTNPLSILGNKSRLSVRLARKVATAVNAQLDAGINPAQVVRNSRSETTLGELFEHYAGHLMGSGYTRPSPNLGL